MSKITIHAPPSMILSFSSVKTSTPVEPARAAVGPSPIDQFQTADDHPALADPALVDATARGIFGDVPGTFVREMVASVNTAHKQLRRYLDGDRDEGYEVIKVVANNYFDAIDAAAKRAAAGSEMALHALDEVVDDLAQVVNGDSIATGLFLKRQERRMPDDLKPVEERRADTGSQAVGLEERLMMRAHSLDYLWLLYRGIVRNALLKDGYLDEQLEYLLLEYLSELEEDLVVSSVLNVVAPLQKKDQDRVLSDVSAFRAEYVRLGKNVATLMNDLDVDAIVKEMIDDPQEWVRRMDACRFTGHSLVPLWGIQELVHVLKRHDRFRAGVEALANKALRMDDPRMFDYFMALAVRHSSARRIHYKWFLATRDSDQNRYYRRQSLKTLVDEGDPIAAAMYARRGRKLFTLL